MGLDMYLTKKTYVKQWEHKTPEEQFEVVVKKGGVTYPNINPSKITYVEEEVMYWRKANHIHNWFVENTQEGNDNCQTSFVSRENINELVSILKQVKQSLEKSKKGVVEVVGGWKNGEEYKVPVEVFEDTEIAEELLPTASGFFFGGTEYDEYYLETINNTLEVLEKELEDEDSKKEMTKKDIEEQFSNLQKELPEFQKVQIEILENMEKMDPLLEKAESFINKYSEYRDSNRKKK